MKKHIALFMIALMAVSVVSAAGVVIAKTEPLPDRYTLVYGEAQTWTGSEVNYHFTENEVTPADVFHAERSSDASASTKLKVDAGESGLNSAWLGVKYTLTGITDWETQKTTPVRVVVKMSYTLTASGEDEYTRASIAFMQSEKQGYGFDGVQASGQKMAKQVTQILTTDASGHMLTVEDLAPFFGSDTPNPNGMQAIKLSCQASCLGVDEPTPQQASASMTIDSITIEFYPSG